MGVFTIPIQIAVRPGEVFHEFDATVDTGATMTSLPASVLEGIGIRRAESVDYELANGETGQLDIGEARVRVDGRETWTWVLFGEETSPVLLGAMTLEELLLGVDPRNGRLTRVSVVR